MPESSPAIPRLLTICADDFGLSHAISAGIAQLAQARRISAISCITNASAWTDNAALLADTPESVGIGLHLNLTEGKPLSPELACLWPRLPSLPMLMLRARLGLLPSAALGCEIRAQWAAFCKGRGRPPAFVDGHQHVHHLPGVRDALLAALETFAVRPAIRNTATVAGPGNRLKRWLIRSTGGKHLQTELRRRNWPHNSCLVGAYDFQARDYRALMRAWLAALPGTGGLLFCHPALASADDRTDAIRDARVREWRYLASDAFAEDLVAANVMLVRDWQ